MKIANRSPSIKNKSYSVDQSPFFKLKSKKKLAKILGVSLADIKNLSSDSSYRVFTTESGRTIEEPLPRLKSLHRRIGKLLNRVELPAYLHSGRKKHSTITNASSHQNAIELLKLDIQKFFPSSRATKVYKMFNELFCMSPDVAYLITNIVTYSGKVPTGSPISMSIAYWANKPMFDQLNDLAIGKGLVFTTYVDDVAFSGKKIPKGLSGEVKRIIESNGLLAKKNKERFYPSYRGKLLTGVIIRNGDLSVRFSHNQSMRDVMVNLSKADGIDKIRCLEVLSGKLNAAGQIENRFRDRARFFSKILKDERSKF